MSDILTRLSIYHLYLRFVRVDTLETLFIGMTYLLQRSDPLCLLALIPRSASSSLHFRIFFFSFSS
jgi:hypothetical protein